MSSSDVQDVYAVLLARDYHQTTLFADLSGGKRSGREMLRDCPFCGKASHFTYSLERPVWRCFVCQEKGDWISYLQKRRGLDFIGALAYLAREAGLEIAGIDQQAVEASFRRSEMMEAAQELLAQALDSPAGAPVLEYLLERGYSREELAGMEVGAYTGPDGLKSELEQAGYSLLDIQQTGLLTIGWQETEAWVTLPWRDQAGRLINFIGRPPFSSEELKARDLPKYYAPEGSHKGLGFSGFDKARGDGQAVLVEGVLDAPYLNFKGSIPAAISIGSVTLSTEQMRAMERVGIRELLLAMDQDEAGQKATFTIIQQLLSGSDIRPLVVSWPEAYKDPDELVREIGMDFWQKAADSAESWPKWTARYLAGLEDIHTDKGREKVLRKASDAYGDIEDPLDRRDFRDALAAAAGLSPEELEPRLAKAREQASREQAGHLIQSTLKQAGAKVSEGDLEEAETLMASGLEKLRTSRGISAPEPYLLEDLERDVLMTSEGLKTGYASLDQTIRIPQGAITLVAGRPGHGKTTLLLNLLVNMLRQESLRDQAFCFFSYEESKTALAVKLIMLMAGRVLNKDFNYNAHLNYLQEKRGTDRAIDEAIACYQEAASSGRLILSDERLCAEDLASSIGAAGKQRETGAVFVDYIQKIPVRQAASQRYLDIQKASGIILDQAVWSGIPIILGAQLRRPEKREDIAKAIRLDNLRESGDLEQDANLVIGIQNATRDQADIEELEDPRPLREKLRSAGAELIVTILKNRNGQQDQKAKLVFDKPVLKIKALDWSDSDQDGF